MKPKKTNRSTRKKAEMAAYAKVIAILEPFPNDAKLRIVKATAILLGDTK